MPHPQTGQFTEPGAALDGFVTPLDNRTDARARTLAQLARTRSGGFKRTPPEP